MHWDYSLILVYVELKTITLGYCIRVSNGKLLADAQVKTLCHRAE